MPTVMMMMILGMRNRDVLLQCPCTALPSQAKGRGASGDLAEAPQQKPIHRGWENTAPADSPYGSQFAPFYGPLMEREISSTECLNSCILYPSITVLILFFSMTATQTLTSHRLQNVHSKTRLVCFQILEKLNSLSRCLMCLKLGTHLEFTNAAYTAKENEKTNKPTNFKEKQICQGLAAFTLVCAFVQPHGGEHYFFSLLRLGCSRCQGLDAKSKPHAMCSFRLPETILT